MQNASRHMSVDLYRDLAVLAFKTAIRTSLVADRYSGHALVIGTQPLYVTLKHAALKLTATIEH